MVKHMFCNVGGFEQFCLWSNLCLCVLAGFERCFNG